MESKEKSCLSCPVWSKSIFKDFNNAQLKHLDSIKKTSSHKKNESLFKQGQEVDGIYCNASGLLKISQKNLAGKIIFSRFAFPGDTVGHRSIFVEDQYKGTCEVVSDDAEACFINKKDVVNLFSENNEFAKSLIFKISHELDRSVNEHILLNESTAFSRLCALLLKLFDEYSENKSGVRVLKSAISKVDIARSLAVADETVIRFMSELQRNKIIHISGKKISLLNESKLRQYAG
ncbi:Crp/Fnr family transcriptional regulator [bacterium]|nr:Crp/Fnr family transcriptional regulator [bacterium]